MQKSGSNFSQINPPNRAVAWTGLRQSGWPYYIERLTSPWPQHAVTYTNPVLELIISLLFPLETNVRGSTRADLCNDLNAL